MQNSLRELLRLGIQPDIVIGRFTHHTGYELDTKLLEKIAMFSNLEPSSVIAVPDLPSIYSVPNFLVNTQITKVLEKFLSSDNNKRGFLMPKPVKIQNSLPDFWQNIKDFQPTKSIRIGIVTKYTKLSDSYLSVIESLKLAGVEVSAKIEICLIDGDKLEENDAETWNILRTVGGILVPGGFGGRALVGKILAAKFARENIIPFLGICLGMQMAVTEFAQNVCGLAVTSREILENRDDVQVQECIIDYMPDQQSIERKGGTMRLGSYQCQIEPNSLAYSLFQSSQVKERHRHRLEVQSQYLDQLESYGMVVSGKFVYSEDSHQSFLPEMVELKSEIHPFYIGTQSHPEFLSRPGRPHPLFLGFIRAIVE